MLSFEGKAWLVCLKCYTDFGINIRIRIEKSNAGNDNQYFARPDDPNVLAVADVSLI